MSEEVMGRVRGSIAACQMHYWDLEERKSGHCIIQVESLYSRSSPDQILFVFYLLLLYIQTSQEADDHFHQDKVLQVGTPHSKRKL